MKPERWQQLDKLFHSALERELVERAAFLADACAGDESLRKEVEALLAAHDEAGSFIERPAMEVEARGLAGDQETTKAALSIGKSISHYRIIAPLGAGGMGQVYLAQDLMLGRRVALKLLPASFTEDVSRLRRFELEARAASALNHPNIITVHEIGQVGSTRFIVTEFVDGVTLRQHMEDRRLALDEALDIAVQVASALVAAHGKGIVHRDIKPENIMVQKESYGARENIKVLDFGIAKLAERPRSPTDPEMTTQMLVKTEEGIVIGTASYMSPEQARGERVDARTDIWSLGVTLYEMLSKQQPFAGDTAEDIRASILKEKLPPIPAEIPDRLRWIVEKALRKDREERYQTAKEMLSDLRELQKQAMESEVIRERSAAPVSRTEAAITRDGREALVDPIPEPAGGTSKIASARETSDILRKITQHKRLTAFALSALVMAAAMITFGLYQLSGQRGSRGKPATSQQTMKFTRLTNNGKAAYAAISPDGKYVVHVMENAGQQSLRVRQVATNSDKEIISPSDFQYGGLTFSQDGDYLYYIGGRKVDYAAALYRTPLLGGAARKLIEDIDTPVTFSPDGKRLAFVRGYPGQNESALMIANSDGTG